MRGACGNVIHDLMSLCHKAGNGDTNGRHCPKYLRAAFLPDIYSTNEALDKEYNNGTGTV